MDLFYTRAPVALAALLSALLTASTAEAQMEWTGAMSDSWFVGNSWNPVGPPSGTDDVVIDTVNPNATVIGLADAEAREVTVGDAGAGHLTIRDGNALSNSNVARIGRLAGADGTVVVTDLGTVWSIGSNLQVGSAGEGHLLITDSAQVSNNQAFVGLLDGGVGNVTVTGAGSVWDNGFDLWVAQTGTGTVHVESGGVINSPSSFLALQPEAQGTVTVSGNNSAWNMTGGLTVGSSGTGVLDIEDQGLVSNTTGIIGDGEDSSGTVTVTGTGSTWNNSAGLRVGNEGAGILNIADGAAVTNAFGAILADEEPSQGTVTVSGTGSTWTSGGHSIIGRRGTGTLNIDSGGQIFAQGASIGFFADSVGTATVSGSNSGWTLTAHTLIGDQGGTGTLTIEDGAVVNTGDLGRIGSSGPSMGTVLLSGANSTWLIGGDLLVGPHNPAVARLTIGPEATVEVGGEVRLAHVALPGGCDCELRVDGNLSAAGGTLINEDGLLSGNGSVGGGTTTITGTVAPGNSAGTLSTRGMVFEPAAILEFELAAPGGANDRLSASGHLTLDGTLHVTGLGGFGEGTYTLIEYTGTLTDNTLSIGSLPGGFNAAVDTSVPGEINLVVEAPPDGVFSDRFEQ